MVDGILGIAGLDFMHIALSGVVLYLVARSNLSAYTSRKEREALIDRLMAKSLPEFKFQTRPPAKTNKPLRGVPTDTEMAGVEEEEQEREKSVANNNARVEEMLRQVRKDADKQESK